MNAIVKKIAQTVFNVTLVNVAHVVTTGLVDTAVEKNWMLAETASDVQMALDLALVVTSVALVSECALTIITGNAQAQQDALVQAQQAQQAQDDAEWAEFMALVMPGARVDAYGNYHND